MSDELEIKTLDCACTFTRRVEVTYTPTGTTVRHYPAGAMKFEAKCEEHLAVLRKWSWA